MWPRRGREFFKLYKPLAGAKPARDAAAGV
jgi:hypothetical protein